MASVTIIGNKPLGPNGENEQWPEATVDPGLDGSVPDLRNSLTLWCEWYQRQHGKCSSLMITIVDPPED